MRPDGAAVANELASLVSRGHSSIVVVTVRKNTSLLCHQMVPLPEAPFHSVGRPARRSIGGAPDSIPRRVSPFRRRLFWSECTPNPANVSGQPQHVFRFRLDSRWILLC